MINGSPALIPIIKTAGVLKQADWASVPIAGKSGALTDTLGVCDNVAAFKSNGHEAQIKKFLDFAYQDKYQLQFDREYDLLPATVSAANALATDPIFGPFIKALPHCGAVPQHHLLGAGQDPDPAHDRDGRHRQSRSRARHSAVDRGEAGQLMELCSAASQIALQAESAGGASRRRSRPVLWVGPAVALIAVVVLWPVVVLVHSSLQNIAADGFVVGGAGTRNYSDLWHEPALLGVVFRTVLWVVVVVARHPAVLTWRWRSCSTSASPFGAPPARR